MHICIHFVSVPWQTWSLSRTHGIPLPLSDRVTPPPYVCLDTLYVRIWKLPSHCQNSFLCLIYICRKVLYVLMLTWQHIALKRQLNVKEALFRSPLEHQESQTSCWYRYSSDHALTERGTLQVMRRVHWSFLFLFYCQRQLPCGNLVRMNGILTKSLPWTPPASA